MSIYINYPSSNQLSVISYRAGERSQKTDYRIPVTTQPEVAV